MTYSCVCFADFLPEIAYDVHLYFHIHFCIIYRRCHQQNENVQENINEHCPRLQHKFSILTDCVHLNCKTWSTLRVCVQTEDTGVRRRPITNLNRRNSQWWLAELIVTLILLSKYLILFIDIRTHRCSPTLHIVLSAYYPASSVPDMTCVWWDVKPYSINQSIRHLFLRAIFITTLHV